MVDIAQYTDYRHYLKDYYETVKERNPRFSYQVFSEKAGITSKGLLYNVLQSRRHLSKSHIVGMAEALNLNKKESMYFETLYNYNCSKKIRDRKYYFEQLTSIRAKGSSAWKPQIVRREQYEYYSRWYHSVIRSVIGVFGFSGDFKSLGKLLYPAITPGQAKKSVELLLSLGFIKKETTGDYVLSDKTIVSEPEVISVAVSSFHAQSGELAIAALKELPQNKRNFSGVTIGISERMYKSICKDIEEFRAQLLRKVESDHNPIRTYQLNIQMFPVTCSYLKEN